MIYWMIKVLNFYFVVRLNSFEGNHALGRMYIILRMDWSEKSTKDYYFIFNFLIQNYFLHHRYNVRNEHWMLQLVHNLI